MRLMPSLFGCLILLFLIEIATAQRRGSSRYQATDADEETPVESHRFNTNSDRVRTNDNTDSSSGRPRSRNSPTRSQSVPNTGRQAKRVFHSRNEVTERSSDVEAPPSRQFSSRGEVGDKSIGRSTPPLRGRDDPVTDSVKFVRTKERTPTKLESIERVQTRGEANSRRSNGDIRTRSRTTESSAGRTETEYSSRSRGGSRASGRTGTESEPVVGQQRPPERGRSLNGAAGFNVVDEIPSRSRGRGQSRDDYQPRKTTSRLNGYDTRKTAAADTKESAGSSTAPHARGRGNARNHVSTAESDQIYERGRKNARNGHKEEAVETSSEVAGTYQPTKGTIESAPEVSPPAELASTEGVREPVMMETSPQVREPPLQPTSVQTPVVPEVTEESPKVITEEEMRQPPPLELAQVEKNFATISSTEPFVSSTEMIKQSFSKVAPRRGRTRGNGRHVEEYEATTKHSRSRTGGRRVVEDSSGFRTRDRTHTQELPTQSFNHRERNSVSPESSEPRKISSKDEAFTRRSDTNLETPLAQRGGGFRLRQSDSFRTRRVHDTSTTEATSVAAEMAKQNADANTEPLNSALPLAATRSGRDPEEEVSKVSGNQRHRFQVPSFNQPPTNRFRPRQSTNRPSQPPAQQTATPSSVQPRKNYDLRRNFRKSLKRPLGSELINNVEDQQDKKEEHIADVEKRPLEASSTEEVIGAVSSTERERIGPIGQKPEIGRGRGSAKSLKADVHALAGKKPFLDEIQDGDNYPEEYKQLKKAGRGPKDILVK